MWLDRLTGTYLRVPPLQIESGRYYYQKQGHQNSPPDAPHILFNKHTPNFSGILVDDGSTHCQLSDHVHVFTMLQPDAKCDSDTALLLKALVTLDAAMQSRELVSPMMPAQIIDDLIHLLPFEKCLVEVVNRGHLHKISKMPRLDLHYEDQVTDIARARRLAKGALVHLASHSECWQRQTLNGVIPKKVLARFSEDDYNIYENRVYARLLDKMERHLQVRISALNSLQSTLNQALEFYKSSDIDHRLADAVCRLWGETFNEDSTTQASELLHDTLDQLRGLHKTILGLQCSGLYLLVSRNAQITGGLHLTNILSHDSHYRHLTILWELLDKAQGNIKLTPQDKFNRNQYFAKVYSQYAGLVLRHALQPYMHGKSECSWGGRKLRLQQRDLEWVLTSTLWTEGAHDKELLIIVPWLSELDANETIRNLQHRFIAYPTIDQLTDGHAFYGNRIVLSPLDMYAVERFGQLVDQMLYKELMYSFGKSINKIPQTVLNLTKSPLPSLYVNQQTHEIVVREEILPEVLRTLTEALQLSNANQQKAALELRNLEILTLQKCPVCESEVKLHFQSPIGFRANCKVCESARYLSKKTNQYTFEQKIKGNISFRKFGRRTLEFSYSE